MSRRVVEIGSAVAVGVVLAVIASFFLFPTNSADAPIAAPSTLPLRPQTDLTTFLVAWEQSRTGPYALVGRIERTVGDRVDETAVRHTRNGDRRLEQWGPTAIVTANNEQRTCEVSTDGEALCGSLSPAPSIADEVADLTASFERHPYLIYEDEPGCFLLVADGAAGLGHRFGQETTMCFDDETGAIVSWREVTGDAVEAFSVESISGQVSEDDLTPK